MRYTVSLDYDSIMPILWSIVIGPKVDFYLGTKRENKKRHPTELGAYWPYQLKFFRQSFLGKVHQQQIGNRRSPIHQHLLDIG